MGIDLAELVAGRAPAGVTPRRVLWIADWLPEDSALVASVRGGPEHRAWTLPTVLAAGALTAAQGGNWQRAGGRGARPKPITPPTPRSDTRSARQSLRDWRTRSVEVARTAARPHGG